MTEMYWFWTFTGFGLMILSICGGIAMLMWYGRKRG